MPAPVAFNLTLGAVPANYSATPAQFAADLVARLTITPTAPWSSFQNGGAVPTSNVGPVLLNGVQWLVWNSSSSAYVDITVAGDGIVAGSVPITALAAGTANSVLAYNYLGVPTYANPGSIGQVLTQGATVPTFQDLPAAPGAQYFEAYPSAASTTITVSAGGGTNNTLPFNTVRTDPTSAFNTSGNYVTIPANQVWVLYASVQIDWTASSGNLQLTLSFNNINGSLGNFTAGAGRVGVNAVAVIPPSSSAQNISVILNAVGTTNATMYANSQTNRFGGFRIA